MGMLNRLIVVTLPWVPRRLVAGVARRYVAGATVSEAASVVEELQAIGAEATVDVLGEEVRDPSRVAAGVVAYEDLIGELVRRRLPVNVSVKPTFLGLRIDAALCRESIAHIAQKVAEHDGFLRIDMEDRTTTDATLLIHGELRAAGLPVGVVLQACLRRTLEDIRSLPAGSRVRLCKGIYIEPEAVAWKERETVRANFLACLDALLERQCIVGVATHDEFLIASSLARLASRGDDGAGHEFQMLLGVRGPQRDALLARGQRVRIYVPFGEDWYGYSLRRLRENPEVAGHVLRALFRSERSG